jgi:glyoxylase-like metal-dependent hydrolase (beta-lactamase superfamily II)
MNKFPSLIYRAGIILLAMSGATLAQGQASAVTVSHLKGPLQLLVGPGGSGGNVVASVGEDGILLVDDNYPQHVPAFRQALAALDAAGRQPRFVLNTHWHGDHTGGNVFWAEQGAVLLAHSNVRQRMSTRQDMKALGQVVEPSPKAALPVITYGDSLALHFNGDDIEVQHYRAGHTDGDSVVFYSRQNVVHMGDLFFKDAFPFVDIGSGGNVFSYRANVETILARIDNDTLVVPGHGGLANRADLVRYHRMLVTTSTAVKEALAQGMTLAEITEQGLGEEWASWGGGFIKETTWISFIAASI